MTESVAELLEKRLRERGITLKAASLHVGRNHAYLQQFIERGVPKKLPEDVRHGLAALLRIDEMELKDRSQRRLTSETLETALSSKAAEQVGEIVRLFLSLPDQSKRDSRFEMMRVLLVEDDADVESTQRLPVRSQRS